MLHYLVAYTVNLYLTGTDVGWNGNINRNDNTLQCRKAALVFLCMTNWIETMSYTLTEWLCPVLPFALPAFVCLFTAGSDQIMQVWSVTCGTGATWKCAKLSLTSLTVVLAKVTRRLDFFIYFYFLVTNQWFSACFICKILKWVESICFKPPFLYTPLGVCLEHPEGCWYR